MKKNKIRNGMAYLLIITLLCVFQYSGALADSSNATINSNSVNVRAEKNIKSTKLGKLNKGDRIEVTEYGEDWCKVSSNQINIHGYIMTEYIDMDEAAELYVGAPENPDVPYTDIAHATLFPNSIYGVIHQFDENVHEYADKFPAMSFDYIAVDDFVIDEDGLYRYSFTCVIPLEIVFQVSNKNDMTSDWEAISLKFRWGDIDTTTNQWLYTTLVFVSLFRACDTTLNNEEAMSMVTVLINDIHSIFLIATKDSRKNINGILYDMYYTQDDQHTISISRAK